MAKVVIQSTDSPKNSRVDINNNFTELYTGANIHAATAKTTPVDDDEIGLIDSAASYVLKKLSFLGLKLAMYAGIKPAEGTVWNGKIVPSVASNNLTVALKGLDGNDPSATNPVYATIGGAVRTITSALSKTVNAGANTFNAGSAELATQEVDYFVYLGYNATDGVVLGFSRIPFASNYNDFSATATNEKYCAISTITNAAATDYYNVIGRFAATLSAGAGYTWTVPTFTAKNLIQRPIYNTRFLLFSSITTGFDPAANGSGFYKIIDNFLFIEALTGEGTSNASTYTTTIPMKALNNIRILCRLKDNGTVQIGYGLLGDNLITWGKGVYSSGGFTSSGTKGISQCNFSCLLS